MLTDTASWPQSGARFALAGVTASVCLFGLLRLSWVESHAVLPFTLAEAAVAVRVFGASKLPMEATLACSGADAVALALGAILAYPVTWRSRAFGASGAIALIVLLNILRIGSLGRVAGSLYWFAALHLYIWPALLTLAIAGFVLTWMHLAQDAPPTAAARPPAPPRLTRRFVVLGAIFLVAFVAAAPLYLQNSAVLAVAGLTARVTAAILGGIGVYAVASANVLWTSHGGFSVTEECLSTPLIPVYLAAVCAYAPNWKRLWIGVLAAAPIFVALGIARLLVVAAPASFATQVFLVHAFYQLLVGLVIVFAAAYWRHRGGSAIGFGLAGIAAGVLLAMLLGPVYSRLIVSVAGRAISDPQGAIAFLPAFGAALYLAMCIASIRRATGPASDVIALRWTTALAGFGVLAAVQTAALFLLNWLAAHTALTVAVRDVRALAIAAPILAFGVVVSLGRARR